MPVSKRNWQLVVLLVWLTVPEATLAQNAVQVPMQFDFINPGAKSLALGGAFAGAADDATAGFANPAGLRELNRPEISVEIRGRRLESLFLERGRLSGSISNQVMDTIPNPVFGEAPDNRTGLSYVAAVYASPRRRWAIAGFRHELARVDQQYLSQGVFQKDPAEITSRRDFPQLGIREFALTSYAAAGAVEVTPRLAVGATLNIYTFDLLSDFRRFDHDGFFGPPILTTEFGRSTQAGDGISVVPTVGVRGCLKRCDDRATTSLRGGIVYRRGPSFEFDTQDGPNQRINMFRVPHVLAFGAALEVPQPGRRLLFMAEVTRIMNSRLVDDFIVDQALASGVQSNLFIDDGTEFHFGFQYLDESSSWLPRYRGGVWIDPDHSVNFRPSTGLTDARERLLHERMAVALSPGERELHYTGGIGLTVHPRFELNVGADVSQHAVTISTSLVMKLTQ
jgi:long-chain fatty acid transport protein